LLVFKDEPSAASVVLPVTTPAVALPSTEAPASAVENVSGTMVVTTVHSAAVAAQAAQNANVTAPASASGVTDGK
jgi:hypothetical protein